MHARRGQRADETLARAHDLLVRRPLADVWSISPADYSLDGAPGSGRILLAWEDR